jgi:hypothetical protein
MIKASQNPFTCKPAVIRPSLFLGVYANLAALQTEHATAQPGNWAIVQIEDGPDLIFIWDTTENQWVTQSVSFNQNNKIREVFIGFANNRTERNALLNSTNMVVADDENVIITYFTPFNQQGGYVQASMLWKLGKGEYAPIGADDFGDKFFELPIVYPSEDSIDQLITAPEAVVRDYGTFTGTILEEINTNAPVDFDDETKVYYIRATKDDITYLWRFNGTNGTYGTGELQMDAEDIELLFSSETSGAVFDPSTIDLAEFLNESENPFQRLNDMPIIQVDEGNGIGFRLRIVNPENNAQVGLRAFDFSTQTINLGRGARGSSSIALGVSTDASGTRAFAGGNNSRTEGDNSIAYGLHVLSPDSAMAAFGLYNDATQYGTGAFARVFSVGNGTSTSNRRDAFSVFRNGAVKFFSAALDSVTNFMPGLFILNSNDTNRPNIYNGTAWKALAYTDEIPALLGFTPEDVANKATNLTSPDNTKYPTTQAVVDGLAFKQNLPTVQSSSITAVLDEVYNNVGNNTYTDPTGVEGKFYTVNVLSGVATIGGVGYTEGSIVRRIFEGGVWKSKEYKDMSKMPYRLTKLSNVELTGTTSISIIDHIEVPGGKLKNGSKYVLYFDFTKIFATAVNIEIFVNTSLSLSGGTSLFPFTGISSNRWMPMERSFIIENDELKLIPNIGTTVLSNQAVISNNLSGVTLSVNLNNPLFFMAVTTPVDSTQRSLCRAMSIVEL